MIYLVADVHGADDLLRRAVRGLDGPLVVLGDLINFVDYRTYEGMVTEVAGMDFTKQMVDLRTAGQFEAARRQWLEFATGREDELRARYGELVTTEYAAVGAALAGVEAYVIYGNVDRPEALRQHLPESARFVDAAVLEVDGHSVGFAGGGIDRGMGIDGEVSDDEMEAKLADLGGVDMLCTHVPPAVEPLSRDVIGGPQKGSQPVLDFVLRHRPRWHYFGDIHQPQAVTWRVGSTRCHNVGYFRATGRVVLHG